MATEAGTLTATTPAMEQHERETILDIFRRWGYLQASLDPLGKTGGISGKIFAKGQQDHARRQAGQSVLH